MESPIAILLPPWRFGSKIKRASEKAVDFLSDRAVIAEWLFAVLVVVGVVGEFVIAYRNLPSTTWEGRWGPAYADLMIALGVAGEVLSSMVSHVCQSELTRRSNKELADAKKALAWRVLSVAQTTALDAALKKMTPESLEIWHMANDPESQFLAVQFETLFGMAGWKVARSIGSYGDEVITGIRVPDQPEPGLDPGAAAKVQLALHQAAIDFVPRRGPTPYMDTGPFGVPVNWPRAFMYVGPKPMPTP